MKFTLFRRKNAVLEKHADPDFIRKFYGPGQVDQMLRQAVSICWIMLPLDRRTVANVEVEIRRILDRVLRNLNEDAEGFGIKPDA